MPLRTVGLTLALLAPIGVVRADELPAARSTRLSLPRPLATLASRADAARWTPATLIELNPLDNNALARLATARAEPGRPREIGVVRPLPPGVIDPATLGVWSVEPDGTSVWRLQLTSPGARSMRVHFSTFDLPSGATLLIAGPEPAAPAHAYKGIGPPHTRDFWSNTVFSDRVLIEYRAAPGVTAAPFIEIDALVHDFALPGENVAIERGFGGDTLPCQVDVTCETVNTLARDSVGQMRYVEGVTNYVCTGALLNDADVNSDVPWFLTANHCISDADVAESLEVTWFFQTSTCDGAPPNPAFLPDSLGASLIATSTSTDFTLLELSEQPPANVGFAGWSTSAASGALFGIHHPAGSWKRYTTFSIISNPGLCSGLPTSRFLYLNQNDGIIEGGSSGSPAFNSNNQVVGQLYGTCGGSTNCSVPPDAVYGRFSASYAANNLAQYLFAPSVSDDAYENNDSFDTRADIDEGLFNLALRDAEDYYEIALPQASRLTIEADFSTSDMDLDLFLYRSDTTLVDSSLRVGPSESIIRGLPAGTCVLRVNRYSGAGGAYTLAIDIEPGLVSDLNDDGEVEVGDVVATLLGWGVECAGGPSALCPDLTGDDAVDINDLNIVLRDYGYQRADYNTKRWKKAMKTFYNTELLPLFEVRTGRQKKRDLKNLNTAAP